MAMTRCGMTAIFAGALLAAGCGVAQAQMQSGGMQQQPEGQQQQQSPAQRQPGAEPNANGMPGMNGTNEPGGLSMQDHAFLHDAAQGGMFEVQAGQLAQQKGQSDDVKQFGARMVRDHTQLDNSLMPFLKQADMKPPTKLAGKDKKELAKLKGLNGAAFDQQYVAIMTKDHEHDLEAFKEEAMSTQSPALKSAVQQGQQVITMHLNIIRKIGSSMGSASGM